MNVYKALLHTSFPNVNCFSLQALKRKDDDSDKMSASTPPESDVGERSTSSQGKRVGGSSDCDSGNIALVESFLLE